MSTMLAVYNSDGCVGRCDAKCYDAVSPDCDCVCGGKNHGAGQRAAQDNTNDLARSWVAEYRKAHPDSGALHFELGEPQAALAL